MSLQTTNRIHSALAQAWPAITEPPTSSRTILVPLDTSRESQGVLPLAAAVAASCGASLRLVNVRTPAANVEQGELHWVDDGRFRSLRLRANVYLDGLAGRVSEAYQVQTTAETVVGWSVAAVLSELCDSAVQLVIMARKRRSASQRFWFGSLTNHLLCRIPVPLLLVSETERAWAQTRFRRVLLLDDPDCGNLVAHAASLTNGNDAEFRLLRVLPLGLAAGFSRNIWERSPGDEAATGALTEAWLGLRKTRQAVTSHGLRAKAEVLFAESAGQAVVNQAAGYQADLIALTRHRHFLPWWIAGCLPEYVARHSASNLLIVPSHADSNLPN
jgi:nucleotide-binding universal stress UspA family protein